MSYKTFFISDTHFGHKGILAFETNKGKLRDFENVEQMDTHMVMRWNQVVRPCDTVYHLGDVAMNRKALPILGLLNGRKILIKGNHDIFKLKDYTPYFEDIRAYKIFPEQGIICSHIPIHPESLERWKMNIHGHLHANTLNDPRYRCVSVEQINYTPIEIGQL